MPSVQLCPKSGHAFFPTCDKIEQYPGTKHELDHAPVGTTCPNRPLTTRSERVDVPDEAREGEVREGVVAALTQGVPCATGTGSRGTELHFKLPSECPSIYYPGRNSWLGIPT
eukprot:188943-Rhodomonas_salina.1